MKCYCNETDSQFIYYVEDAADTQFEDTIQIIGWKKADEKLFLPCPIQELGNLHEKELVSKNFANLGQAMFESILSGCDWKKPLELITKKFNENGIEWYLVGSAGDAMRGIGVKPKDLDIVVHTRDFNKAKNICYSDFSDSVILHFSDNQKLCPLRCFGRLFLAGALIEIAADEYWDSENHQPQYEVVAWNGCNLYVESLQLRYQTEINRKRTDRSKAIEEYMKQQKI